MTRSRRPDRSSCSAAATARTSDWRSSYPSPAGSRDGRRRRQVSLDEVELDYGEPMRFERAGDGYVLIDKRQVLWLDQDLALKRRQRPFAPLVARGVIDGSFNDAVLHEGALYGYADFIDAGEKPAVDPQASGKWRRGFVRLDPAAGELEMLHELPLEDAAGEYASYYLYDRRPYVARLGGKVYVLRFTEPWTLHRVTRRGLRQIAAGGAGDEDRAQALTVWNGRLYVLTSRAVPDPEAEEAAAKAKPATGTSPNLGGERDATTFLFLPTAEIVAGAFSCEAEAEPSSSG